MPEKNYSPGRVEKNGRLVLDFVGIFDKLSKALAFDSDEVNAIVKDLALLKDLFKSKMETKAPGYLRLITRNFDDKDVDGLIVPRSPPVVRCASSIKTKIFFRVLRFAGMSRNLWIIVTTMPR